MAKSVHQTRGGGARRSRPALGTPALSPLLDEPLDISSQALGFIVAKARGFDSQVAVSDLESGSNPADDGEVGVLESTPDNPAEEELFGALEQLGSDELGTVLALFWLGRGDFGVDAWAESLAEAKATCDRRTIGLLMGTPMIGDFLEEGAAALGIDLSDDEVGATRHRPL